MNFSKSLNSISFCIQSFETSVESFYLLQYGNGFAKEKNLSTSFTSIL